MSNENFQIFTIDMFNTYLLTYVFHELDKNSKQAYHEGFIFVCDETWNKFIDI